MNCFILITCQLDNILILQGEITCWSANARNFVLGTMVEHNIFLITSYLTFVNLHQQM